jgi:hypothetical protein
LKYWRNFYALWNRQGEQRKALSPYTTKPAIVIPAKANMRQLEQKVAKGPLSLQGRGESMENGTVLVKNFN